MAGFGKQKNSVKRKKSKQSSKLPPDQLKALAIRQHINGKIVEAEKAYQAFLETGLNDPDVLSNYALILEQTGREERALQLYKKCVHLFPGHSSSCANLGYLYLSLGRLEEAEQIILKAIDVDPKLPNSYSILGLIYKARCDYEKAESFMRKAIRLKPDFPDAYINLGLILRSKNNLEEAENFTRKALELQPKSADAFLNLGTILQDFGKLEEAEIATRRAIELQPGMPDAHMNLGVILKDLGKLEEAVIHAKEETDISADKPAPFLLLSSLLKECDLSAFSKDQIRLVLSKLLPRDDIPHIDLFRALNYLVPEELLVDISQATSNVLDNDSFSLLINEKLVIRSLQILTFNTSTWEAALTKIRRDICTHSNLEKHHKRRLIGFTIALAEQCFLNEYIFQCSEEEINALESIKSSFLKGNVDEFAVALLSCYIPLHVLVGDFPLIRTYQSQVDTFQDLIDLQLNEPIAEKELVKSLRKVGSINDNVSKKVRAQYEENPYPRWRYTSHMLENQVSIVSAINSEIRPNRISTSNLINKRSKVLIAGCGTGQQIFDAQRYQNAEITAIDLSAKSIAYAKRKIIERGIENVNFIQMDILEVALLNQEFDVVECGGVLHHMDSPSDGLESLINVLNPNGYMKLALYSELARTDIVKARNFVDSEDIEGDNEGIRFFRKNLLSGKYPELKSITSWSDFYTTSMCRDLCFHVQEHRFTIYQLAELLAKFNLNFLGFILPQSIKQQYGLQYRNDPSSIDLMNWNKFEESNPDTFRSMYQFWANRKMASPNQND